MPDRRDRRKRRERRLSVRVHTDVLEAENRSQRKRLKASKDLINALREEIDDLNAAVEVLRNDRDVWKSQQGIEQLGNGLTGYENAHYAETGELPERIKGDPLSWRPEDEENSGMEQPQGPDLAD